MRRTSILWFIAAGLFAIAAATTPHARASLALAVVFFIFGTAAAKRNR